MILRGLLLFLTTVSNCVLSLPVTSSHLENEDVKVMKCIVEALADVLSRPHPLPVSQECLVILRTDDRLVSILRHHNFLKELQDIAVLGERAQLQGDIIASDHVTSAPQSADDVPDRSMLEALGGPGERSILTQKKRTRTASGEEEEGGVPRLDRESREHNEIDGKSQEKRGKDEKQDNHASDPVKHWSEDTEEKRGEEGEVVEEEEEEEEDEEEKRATSVEENSNGHESSEKRGTPESKSEEKKSAEEVDKEEEEEEEEGEVEKKRSTLFSHASSREEEEEADRRMKAEDGDGLKKWTKRNRKLSVAASAAKRGDETAVAHQQHEVPHHSKEVLGGKKDQSEESRRSPEVKELQMIARRAPEDRRGKKEEEEDEEGSAGRKAEEPEIESLAAIESELESVAQKLHELRRG